MAEATAAATAAPTLQGHAGQSPTRAYSLRPAFHHRFRSSVVKDCIHEVLKEELANVQYTPEEIPNRTKLLSETIRDKLKAWLPDVFGILTLTTTLRMFS